MFHKLKLGGGTTPRTGTQQIGPAFHGHALHMTSAVGTAHQPSQRTMHSAIPSRWDVAPGHDGLHLVIGFLVDDGGVKAIHNRPALAGIVDGDMLGIPFASLTDVGLLIPHDFPGEGGVAEDVGHAVAGKLRGAVGLGAQGIDVTSDGDAAVTLEIQVVHHADKLGLRLVDLQTFRDRKSVV